MGLSVHFKLAASPDTDAVRARELVQAMRRRAQGFKQRGRVDNVLPIGDNAAALRWAIEYQSIPHPEKPGCFSGIEIPAEAGYIFRIAVGQDCEPLWLGLCRYPKTVLQAARRYRTHLPGWRLSGFSKTQYASLHGWEHFRRCHTAVVDLLRGMRGLGLAVEINDEADYWPDERRGGGIGRSVKGRRQRRGQRRTGGIAHFSASAVRAPGSGRRGKDERHPPTGARRNFTSAPMTHACHFDFLRFRAGFWRDCDTVRMALRWPVTHYRATRKQLPGEPACANGRKGRNSPGE